MEQNERKLLQKILRTSEENNEILKKIYSSIKWGRVFKVAYWLVIIGAAVGAFYFLQPFIDQLRETFGVLQSGVSDIKNTGQNLPDLKNMLQGQ